MNKRVRISPIIANIVTALTMLYILWRALQEFNTGAYGTGNWFGAYSWKFVLGFVGFAFLFAISLVIPVLILWQPEKAARLERQLARWRQHLGWVRWPLAALFLLLPIYILEYSHRITLFAGIYLHLLLFLGAGLAIAIVSTHSEQVLIKTVNLATGLLLLTSALHFAQALEYVTDYPFSLTWSEGNRIWDFSVLFGRRLYDYPADQPIFAYIDLGRQALWGLPFLLPKVTIAQVRLWSGLVFSVPYALFGWVVFKKPGKIDKIWLLLGLWTFVFLSQGPIYTPLVLSAILVAIAWRRPLWIALPLIVIAGYYAQASRFTWMFAPAMWAGMIYFANPPAKRIGTIHWRLAFLGALAGALGGYILPNAWKLLDIVKASKQQISENNVSSQADLISVEGIHSIVTRQPLLWERLFPNPTYEPGILLGVALVSLPLILILIYLIQTNRWSINRLQGGVILVTLLLFLGVGLVISVKIGGGSNLHNLDMYLIGLVFAAALAWHAGGDQILSRLEREPEWLRALLVVMMIIFAYQPLERAGPLILPATKEIEKALEVIQTKIDQAKDTGEILFIDQRQLLTFGFVETVPLVPDYEKKYLMDQAMTGDAEYFAGFYQDLAQPRFSLIISEPLKAGRQDGEGAFVEENNLWVKWVSRPVLCYYKPIETFKELKVQLLVPRKNISKCPK